MGRPLVVGLAPSARAGAGDRPLTGRSGRRLAGLAGLSPEEFWGIFDRTNLLAEHPGRRSGGRGDVFGATEARRAAVLASELLAEGSHPTVIVLGRKAAEAFGLRETPWFSFVYRGGIRLAVVPHPSGFSSYWNEPVNRREAEAFWSRLAREEEDHGR